MLGGGWLGVQLGQPGVLLLRRLGPLRAEGVAVAMFGRTGLGMLIWLMSGHVLELLNAMRTRKRAFSIFAQ
jgi:hypothetical protein